MKKIFNYIFCIFIIGFLLCYSDVRAYDELNDLNTDIYSQYDNIYTGHSDYFIKKYHVDINVNENNSFDITEYITAYFNVYKHGIYRKIPLVNDIVRNDGSKSRNHARITNMKVSEVFSKSFDGNYYVVKIGDPNYTLMGEKTYSINYNYSIGRDSLKGSDEFYFNIIGDEWDTSIENVSFKITMPKDFDSSKLGFSSGKRGVIGSNSVSYDVNENVITGEFEGKLNAGEALTVRLGLDDGYFVYEINYEAIDYICYLLPLVFVFISFVLWKKYGKDEELVETVEFYPPEGFNSLETEFLYKGRSTNKGVVSLLIYLANKGYIRIEEYEENFIFKQKSFKIIKLKDYDGDNVNEKLFLEGLFKKKNKLSMLIGNALSNSVNDESLNEVCANDLYNSFYVTARRIISNTNTKSNKHKIYEKTSLSKIFIVFLLTILTFFFITVRPTLLYGGFEIFLTCLLFPSFGFLAIIAFVINGKGFLSKIIGVLWGIGFGGFAFYYNLFPLIRMDALYLLGYIVGLVCVVILNIFLRIMPKRTKYGNEILGKVSGFKTFLETAEKSRLESLVMQNPTYFYDILPYTYVLDVSKVWMEKFKNITMEPPRWYGGSSSFDIVTFSNFINTTMDSAQRNMSSSSSGGGSSGGGSGGGGGGSW